jgi:CHRD domain
VRFRLKVAVGVAVLGIAGVGTAAIAHDRGRFEADISGFQEVPTLSTDANGQFKASISRDGDTIHYVLSYRGPFNANNTEAGGTVTQAHIHLGAPAVNGGIIVFLCANPPMGPPAGVPTPPVCPATTGTAPVTVTGELTAADVIGPNGQGIAPMEFDELVRAMRAGATYVNLHTQAPFAGGEIRGQVSQHDRGRGH